VRRTTTFAVAAVAAVAAAATLSAPAQAADTKATKSFTMKCQDKANNFWVSATFHGSGKPTATYDVFIRTYDLRSDGIAPKVRLKSYNKDGSNTNYKWRTGPEGQAAMGNFDTTLQQPKGLSTVYIEGRTTDYAFCGDYFPK